MTDQTAKHTAPMKSAETQGAPKLRKPIVSADRGGMWSTLYNLWPYMWPSDRADLKLRVVYATFFMVLGKLVTVMIPYLYKLATDALTGDLSTETSLQDWLPVIFLTPVVLVIAYNVGRVLMMGLNQLRDALFASVGQFAVRQLSTIVFAHLHSLSLRYHLQRRTGGLTRVIERGTKGIEAIVRFSILNGVPTILEFAFMAVVIWYWFDFRYVLVISIMIWIYVWFTVRASDWR
ncbi:MAG: ABC transporter transmembrane domain-containing protein, partial [Pseudomonadota bacterium]